MEEDTKRYVVVGIVVSLLLVGIVSGLVLKNYQMNAVSPVTNLRLYYDADLNESHVIFLENFNWTAATGVIVTNGTVLDVWARNDGNQAANFTFQVMNQVNCSVVLFPAALPNFAPGAVVAMNMTFNNVTVNPSWEISVNY